MDLQASQGSTLRLIYEISWFRQIFPDDNFPQVQCTARDGSFLGRGAVQSCLRI